MKVEEEAAEHSHKLHRWYICNCQKSAIEDDLSLEFVASASVDLRNIKLEIIRIESNHLQNVEEQVVYSQVKDHVHTRWKVKAVILLQIKSEEVEKHYFRQLYYHIKHARYPKCKMLMD